MVCCQYELRYNVQLLSSLAICTGMVFSQDGPFSATVTVTQIVAFTLPTATSIEPVSGMYPALYTAVEPAPTTVPDVLVLHTAELMSTSLPYES